MATVTEAVNNMFGAKVFRTTYQDLNGQDWSLHIRTNQPLYKGVEFGYEATSDIHYVRYVHTDTSGGVPGSYGYVYKEDTGKAFKTSGDATTYFLANYTDYESYVEITEDISTATYSGQFDLVQPGLNIRWEGAVDGEEPILGSALTFSALLSHAQADIIEEALLLTEGNCIAMVYKGNDLFWYGYALPEQFKVTVDEGKVLADFAFTDGLALLENRPWLDLQDDVWASGISCIKALGFALYRNPSFQQWDNVTATSEPFIEVYGAPKPVRGVDEVFELDLDGDGVKENVTFGADFKDWDLDNGEPLNHINFHATSMYRLDRKEKHSTIKDAPNCRFVLENILRALGLRICMFNGRWVVFNPNMLHNAVTPKRHIYAWGDNTSEDLIYQGPVQDREYLRSALGLRLLVDNYEGPLVRGYRLADATEQDFYPNSLGHISLTELDNFANGGAVVAKVLYDQSGSANDAYCPLNSSGTAFDYFAAPILHDGATAYTSGPQGRPSMYFDGTNNYMTFYSPIFTGNEARTVLAWVNPDDESATSGYNPVYSSPSVSTSNGTAWAMTIEDTRLAVRLFGNETFNPSLADTSVNHLYTITLPGGGQIQDHEAYQNGTLLTQQSAGQPTTLVDTEDAGIAYLGAYWVNAANAAPSFFFKGHMCEMYFYATQKTGTQVNDFYNDIGDYINNNYIQTTTVNGPVLIDYDYDTDYAFKTIEEFGSVANGAVKAYSLPAANVKITHAAAGGDFLYLGGRYRSGATLEAEIRHQQALRIVGYVNDSPSTPSPQTDSYYNGSDNRVDYGYSDQDDYLIDVTNEGLKPVVGDNGETTVGYRTGEGYHGGYMLGNYNWSYRQPLRDHFARTYNGRYIGIPSETIENIDLEAGDSLKIKYGAQFALRSSQEAKGRYVGCTPVHRMRVEVTDYAGNKYRLNRKVITYDWTAEEGSRKITIDTSTFPGNGADTVAIPDYYFVKDYEGDAVWLAEQDAGYLDAWYETMAPHGDNEWSGSEGLGLTSPEALQDRGFAPMFTKPETTSDGGIKLVYAGDENNRYFVTVSEVDIELPGIVGETGFHTLYVEYGTEVWHAESGPYSEYERINGSWSIDGTGAHEHWGGLGTLTSRSLWRSANADGTGAYVKLAAVQDTRYINDEKFGFKDGILPGIEYLDFKDTPVVFMSGVVAGSVVAHSGELDKSTSITSFAQGGLGKTAKDLGTTVLGARYTSYRGNLLRRLTSHLMNSAGQIKPVGYHKIEWKPAGATDTYDNLHAENKIFTSLHELVTWQHLNMFGYVKPQYSFSILTTTGAANSGPPAPYLPITSEVFSPGTVKSFLPSSVNWTLGTGTQLSTLELKTYPERPAIHAGGGDVVDVDSIPDDVVASFDAAGANAQSLAWNKPIVNASGNATNDTFASMLSTGQQTLNYWTERPVNIQFGQPSNAGFQVEKAGTYQVNVKTLFKSVSTGTQDVKLLMARNGTTELLMDSHDMEPTDTRTFRGSAVVHFDAGDVITFVADNPGSTSLQYRWQPEDSFASIACLRLDELLLYSRK